ncbi:cytochrome P450 [Bombardia bombarda]|uniref:Cytochrome P450 n=1 Tax=Bombardia bombarda TaxID=252184 RepID=A0AA40CDB8_9PEZI|nr:cytochrome P450 [Bombardia bombarda]
MAIDFVVSSNVALVSQLSQSKNLNILASVLGVVLGLIAHLGFFIRGEWHVLAPQIFVSHSLLFISLSAGTIFCHSSGVGQLWAAGLITSSCYLAALLTSILVYRIWFHPLTRAGFKGPFYLSTSKICHVWECRWSLNHVFLDGLHKKYGDFIRTGPNEITIYHPDVFVATDGPKTECTKSEWYDLLFPDSSLLTTRDRVLHDIRRKEWKECFSPKALAFHFQKSVAQVAILDKVLAANAEAGKPCDMRDLFYWLGFDIMGDFIFNKSFDMLVTQEWHHMVIGLQRALSLLGPTNPAPWLIQLAFHVFPRIYQIGDWFRMTAWCYDQIGTRLEDGFEKQPTPDLVHYLLEKSDAPRTADSVNRMRGDSLNAIVAGSEPIPIILIALFAELAKKPEYIEAVYQEMVDVDILDTKVLSQLPNLNAVIQETLRLYPVLPTAGTRKTGPNGVTIAGVFIPPYTTIVNPRYSIHRREDCFEQATEFIPERWTTRRDMVKNMAAYSPWGTAHHSCIARVMAIDVLRITTAQLIRKYRFRLAPGETGKRVLDDMKDQLAPNPGELTLMFELR